MEFYGEIKLKGALADGTGDPLLTKDATSDEVGTAANALGTLTSAYIFVGNASNVPTGVAVTGDISIDNAGVTAIAGGVIVNADINASAAIAVSKLAALTASRAVVSDGSGFLSVSAVTSTELGYVSGVTSAIQTQLNAKQATITGGATTITSSDLTANRALISSGTGKVAVASVTATELGYVSGVTSAIQTQLDTKLAPTITSVAEGDILYYNGSAWVNLPRGTDGQTLRSSSTTILWDTPTINGIPVGGSDGQVLAKQSGTDFDADWETLVVASITDLTATAAELNILDGAIIDVTELNFLDTVSANIQTQLNGKLSTSLTTDNILVGVGGVATETTNLPTGTTIGSAVIYRVGGTDVTLADGGTGASLADPGADRIMFWDYSAGAVTWLTAGTGLTITDTTISASGAISGLTTNRIPYATSATTLGDDSALTWTSATNILTIDAIRIHSTGSGNTFIGQSSGNTTLTGTFNTVFGALTGRSLTSGTDNTLVGYNAGDSITDGTNNTAIGRSSLPLLTTGDFNSGFGDRTLAVVTTASGNTAVGYAALNQVTGGSNIAIGYNAGNALTSGTGNIIIGYDIDAQSATAAGQLSIQNVIFGTSNTATGTTVSTGNVGIGEPSPQARLHVTKTSSQLRVGYDGSSYFDVSVDSSGRANFNATGAAGLFQFDDLTIVNANLAVGGSFTPSARLHVKGENNGLAIRVADDADNAIIQAGETAGVIGIGLYGVSPAIRASTATGAATFAANTSGISDDSATWDGYTVGQVVLALRLIGILT